MDLDLHLTALSWQTYLHRSFLLVADKFVILILPSPSILATWQPVMNFCCMDESIFIISIVVPQGQKKKTRFDMRVAFYLNDSVMRRMTDLTGLSSLIHVNM